MAKIVKCAFDGDELYLDEAESLEVPGEGSRFFCGPDCHVKYLARKSRAARKSAGPLPGPTSPAEDELVDRVDRLESKLDRLLNKLLGDEDKPKD